jgi:hypothetical protein
VNPKGPVSKKLQDALEETAEKHAPGWYKVEIFLEKKNPITDYKIILHQQDPP